MSRRNGSLGLLVFLLVTLAALVPATPAGAAPEGQMTWAVHTTLVPYLFSGASGNAATWLEAYAVADGTYVYGSYPDVDGLFREQAAELDRAKREAILRRAQQLVHDKAMFAPIWDFAFLHGVGPRVEESGLGLLGGYGFSAPYEDVKLRAR